MLPLNIALARSRLLLAVLLTVGLVAAAVAWLLPWPLAPRAMLSAWCLACAAYAAARHAMLVRPDSVLRLEIDAHGTLHVTTRDSARWAARVHGESYVTPWLTVLLLRAEGRRGLRAVALVPDMLPAEDFRRLRVWLRWASLRPD